MNEKYVRAIGTLGVWATLLVWSAGQGVPCAYGTSQYTDRAQDKEPPKGPQASEAESKASMKIQAAPDMPGKLQAAAEFIKKYPKSTLRVKVVGYLASEINNSPNTAQRISWFESLLATFKEPSDSDVITPLLFDAYVKADPPRVDDAFKIASALVAKNPQDLTSHTQIAVLGVEQAKKGDGKYAQQAQQSAKKAIEIIEAGKKPDSFDEARWKEYQTKWLPVLYQSTGLISLMTGNKADAKANLEKAASLDANDPFTFVLLGSLANDEYQKLAERHRAQSSGPMKDELLKQAYGAMDQVIDLYAHAVGLAEGRAEYDKLRAQVTADLQTYWTHRHNGSTEGLQQLIDKYKRR